MELNLTVKVKDKPYGFGVGIGGTSDTQWGVSGGGGVGADIGNTSEKSNLHGKARLKAFGNWMNSLSGKIYVAAGEGKGMGYDGTVRSDVGAGVAGEIKEQVVAGNKGSLCIGNRMKGFLDKEGHAKVDGDIHSYSCEELKEVLAATSSGDRRINFGFKRTKGIKNNDKKSSTEAVEGTQNEDCKADVCIDKENGEEGKPCEGIDENSQEDIPKESVQDRGGEEILATGENHGEENVIKKTNVKESNEEQTSDERTDQNHGNEGAPEQGDDKKHTEEVMSEKHTD